MIAEHAVLKGRRYGNVVLVAVRDVPEDDGPEDDGPEHDRTDDDRTDDGLPGLDLHDAGLARRLRSLPVPARLLVGDELTRFAGA